jgi:hypothetical protein
MTLSQAIERFDQLYPNTAPYAVKRDLLSSLEGRLSRELFSRYDPAPAETGPVSADDPGDTPLLAPFPYDDLYVKFLAAETDRLQGDVNRYLNSAAVFNESYDALALYLLRTRKRVSPRVKLPEVTA